MRRSIATVLLCIALPIAAHARDAASPRLISLAPSLTELAFAIDAGAMLVGVTEHCLYPPEARAIATVGLYQTPSLETILALRPDWILALEEHAPQFPAFDALGLKYRVFDHRSLDGLFDSFIALGELCGREEKAASLRDALFRAFLPAPAEPPLPSMLLVFGRDYGRGGVSDVYCAGRDGIYNRILESVGCRNAYAGPLAYPVLSAEGIAALNPDAIVELLPESSVGAMGTGLDDQTLLADWRQLKNLPAVRDGRVHILRGDSAFVPGTRLLSLKSALGDIAKRIPAPAGARP